MENASKKIAYVLLAIGCISMLVSLNGKVNKSTNQFHAPLCALKCYPISPNIPSNILSFYIEFDEPMQANPMAFQYVDLVVNGKIIDNAWRQRSYWINDFKTLVMMIHPGRVKHGIQSTYKDGRVFNAGDTAIIQLRPGLLTCSEKTNNGFSKRYAIAVEDKISPKVDSSSCLIQLNSASRYKISFNEKMDFGLLWKSLRLSDKNKRKIPFQLTSVDDKNWTVILDSNSYVCERIKLSTTVGDLAQNQLNRLFEMNSTMEFEAPYFIELYPFKNIRRSR